MNQYDMSRAHVPGQAPEAGAPRVGSSKKIKNMGVIRIIVTMLVVSIAILSIALMIFVVFGGGKTESDLIKKDKFQAVFLNDSTGQVYFGKLTSVNNKYYKLSDIYYVRVSQAVQPDKSTTTTAQQNISLAKLGSELHGPEDEMFISRDQVLFWENLKDDGQVVKAIDEFKKNGGKTTDTTTPTTTTPTTTTPTTTPKK